MRRTALLVTAIIVMLLALPAGARYLDGTLALIRQPISTLPVIVKAGDAFRVAIAPGSPYPQQCRATLYRGEAEYALELTIPDAAVRAQARVFSAQIRVPKEVPPGLYGLQVTLRPGNRMDTAERAVKVVADWPSTYRFAHITDVHIGKNTAPFVAGGVMAEGVETEEVFRRTAAEINRLGVDFVLLTGDLTESAQPEQFRTFLQILDLFTAPTFVTPGNHDRGAPLGTNPAYTSPEPGVQPIGTESIYDRYCGPATYTFDLGRHRYVSLDTRWEEEFLINDAFRGWMQSLLARPDPALGVFFSHRISEVEYPFYQRELPRHNYRLYAFGHTHDDEIFWLGDLTVLNTSEEFMGTYSVVTVSGDRVVSIRHYHKAAVR